MTAGLRESRIRLVRQEAMLSTTQLAQRVGVARATLTKVELGYERPWPKLRRDLARELRVPEAVLFDEGVISLPSYAQAGRFSDANQPGRASRGDAA